MSMFKKIKSLFVIEETEKQTSGPAAQRDVKEENIGARITAEGLHADKDSLDRFIQVLSDAISSKNQQGYDYLEFKEAMLSLKNIETDEARRYVTAFTLAQTLGVNKTQLLESANHYLGVLNTENEKFKSAVDKQKQEKIKSRKTDLAHLDQEMSEKEQKIKDLQAEIDAARKTREQIKLELEEAAMKVEQVHLSFQTAFKTISGQIQGDIEKMNKFLN